MAPRRSSTRGKKSSEDAAKSEAPVASENDNDPDEEEEDRLLPTALRERNRAVAEREASRLARPERRKIGNLGHASKAKSSVSSTPSGLHASFHNGGEEEVQEWCGPFSVARQVRFLQNLMPTNRFVFLADLRGLILNHGG